VAKDATSELAHALRNILGPAMMIAERLCGHSDPAVQRAGKVILDSIDRATAAIKAAAKPEND
jgi:hypothetical protein